MQLVEVKQTRLMPCMRTTAFTSRFTPPDLPTNRLVTRELPVDISSAEDSEEDQPGSTSGRSPPAKKAALNQSQSGPSGWSRPNGHQRPNATKPAQDPAPAAESSHKVLLLVKKSAIDGSCLFDSIAQGLAHILEHDISAFGGNSSRSAQEAIRALTDPMLLRQMICDHLCGPFADVQLACLSDQSSPSGVQSWIMWSTDTLFLMPTGNRQHPTRTASFSNRHVVC